MPWRSANDEARKSFSPDVSVPSHIRVCTVSCTWAENSLMDGYAGRGAQCGNLTVIWKGRGLRVLRETHPNEIWFGMGFAFEKDGREAI